MRTALAICALILPAPAMATCGDDWRQIGEDLMSIGLTSEAPVGLVRDAGGRCRVSGVRIAHGSKSRTDIGLLSWRTGDFGLSGDRTFPHALQLEARDIRLRSDFGDRERNRQLGGLWNDDTPHFDLDVAWNWDAEARQLRLQELILAFTTGDRIAVTGVFDNVDLSTKATSQMAATGFSAPSLTFTIDLDEFLSGEVARATRNSETSELVQEIDGVPGENLAEGARAVLKGMAARKADLQGRVIVDVTADPGLGPARFLPIVMGRLQMDHSEDFWSVMDGVVFDISFEPR